jgi:hypothetical protein
MPTWSQSAAEGAELIHAGGTPPFLVLGYDEERRTIEAWEKSRGVPIFTSAMLSQVRSLVGALAVFVVRFSSPGGREVDVVSLVAA